MPAKKSTKKLATPEAAPMAAAETVIKPQRKRAAAKSPAATHKAAKPRATRPRTAKVAAAAQPVFDAALHHDEIAREAYFLWESRGRMHGNEAEDWYRAVEIVRARYQQD